METTVPVLMLSTASNDTIHLMFWISTYYDSIVGLYSNQIKSNEEKKSLLNS